MTIWEDPQHDVVSGGVVDERPLGVDEKHVRYPDLLHQSPVEGHALVGGAGEGQPLVLPVVPQIQGHGEVLGGGGTVTGLSLTTRSLYSQNLFYYFPLGLHRCGLWVLDYMDCL